ncbi:FecCD family ABC transporter permease [Culicoidibacter larvae]|uniref:Iron ABC transporter permease n=1 Tax=Culicoidibacter larvae TaxID=2579976 RepID=A0A5R8QGA9_9FIRM|nr:iron ABC transporter permease [Culicoidibacter larvae]TLG77071.1 iron ABC transporter permease [Culicoidibacter larvae]
MSKGTQITTKNNYVKAVWTILIGIVLLLFAVALSISLGAANFDLATVWQAIFAPDMSLLPHQIIWELRLPRVLVAVIVGAALSVAGAIMQGVTRNPLADAGLLGLNAGSGFAIAICFAFFPAMSQLGLLAASFVGAGISLLLIYGISAAARGAFTPAKLVLVGASISMLMIAISQAIALYFNLTQGFAFWTAGGVAIVTWDQLAFVTPFIVIGLLLAVLLSRSITVLSLGEKMAIGLGQRVGLVKILSLLVVLILAGASVSLVGAVGFVGLLIPHIVRHFVGSDYRYIIPCSAVLGGLFLVLADFGARMINAPYETPLGAVVALIGVPFFLHVVRKDIKGI